MENLAEKPRKNRAFLNKLAKNNPLFAARIESFDQCWIIDPTLVEPPALLSTLPRLGFLGFDPRSDELLEFGEVRCAPVEFNRCLVGVFFVEEAPRRIVDAEARVELMAIRF